MTYFSFSQLRCYMECPRQYYWTYVMGKFPPPNLSMVFGKSIHAALEVYYRENDTKKAEDVFIDKMVNSAGSVVLKRGESLEKEGEMGLRMLRAYFASPDKPYLKPREIEYRAETILKDPYTGKELDIPIRLVMDMITEEDFIVDHKTSSSMWTMEKIEEDMQASIYWLAFRSIFGKDPAGFIFNFLIKRVKEPKFDAQAVERGYGQLCFAIQFAQDIVNKIRREEFPRRTDPHHLRYCAYCRMNI